MVQPNSYICQTISKRPDLPTYIVGNSMEKKNKKKIFLRMHIISHKIALFIYKFLLTMNYRRMMEGGQRGGFQCCEEGITTIWYGWQWVMSAMSARLIKIIWHRKALGELNSFYQLCVQGLLDREFLFVKHMV